MSKHIFGFEPFLAKLFAKATETLGSENEARRWMTTPNLGLGNRTPHEAAKTKQGLDEAIRILTCIESGGVF